MVCKHLTSSLACRTSRPRRKEATANKKEGSSSSSEDNEDLIPVGLRKPSRRTRPSWASFSHTTSSSMIPTSLLPQFTAVRTTHYGSLDSSLPSLKRPSTVEDVMAEGDKIVVRSTWHATHTGQFTVVPVPGKYGTSTAPTTYPLPMARLPKSGKTWTTWA